MIILQFLVGLVAIAITLGLTSFIFYYIGKVMLNATDGYSDNKVMTALFGLILVLAVGMFLVAVMATGDLVLQIFT